MATAGSDRWPPVGAGLYWRADLGWDAARVPQEGPGAARSQGGSATMRVAFIGLGTMGSRMVANLQEHGHDVTVTDVRRDAAGPALEQGATWADSPREAARDAELILSSLPGPREVEAVALGDDGVINGIAPE